MKTTILVVSSVFVSILSNAMLWFFVYFPFPVPDRFSELFLIFINIYWRSIAIIPMTLMFHVIVVRIRVIAMLYIHISTLLFYLLLVYLMIFHPSPTQVTLGFIFSGAIVPFIYDLFKPPRAKRKQRLESFKLDGPNDIISDDLYDSLMG